MKNKKILYNFILVSLLIGSLYLLQLLFMPKYMSGTVEGSMIESYYDEKPAHDVIFIGDCEVYANYSPITLWENYGIRSFIRGSAQQLVWQSYYLLEETLKYEKPEVVVFNVLAMKYDQPQNEAYNRMTLDGMKLSKEKLAAIQASKLEDENLVDYLFPFLRFHSRWNEVSTEDFKYLVDKDNLFQNGYYMRTDVKPVQSIPRASLLPDYQFGENAYSYLDRMVELCKTNDIELVLVKAPTIYPHWYDEWEVQMEEYAQKHDLTYINFLEVIDQVGIDFDVDTYDRGLHLNLSGAEKLSLYFGKVLSNQFVLKDHRSNEEYSSIWQEKVDFYYAMKEQQLKELEEYGSIMVYGREPDNNL